MEQTQLTKHNQLKEYSICHWQLRMKRAISANQLSTGSIQSLKQCFSTTSILGLIILCCKSLSFLRLPLKCHKLECFKTTKMFSYSYKIQEF